MAEPPRATRPPRWSSLRIDVSFVSAADGKHAKQPPTYRPATHLQLPAGQPRYQPSTAPSACASHSKTIATSVRTRTAPPLTRVKRPPDIRMPEEFCVGHSVGESEKSASRTRR